MNLKRIFVALLTVMMTVPGAMAASNYVEQIEQTSQGNVTIDIPQSILNLLFPPAATTSQGGGKKGVVLRSGVNHMSGYRIQVFGDSHNQPSLESRAKARGSAIAAKFPKYRGQVYSFSKSPSWYTRVGNFMTSGEASAALAELKRAFPRYAGEMRVVKCEIIIIK